MLNMALEPSDSIIVGWTDCLRYQARICWSIRIETTLCSEIRVVPRVNLAPSGTRFFYIQFEEVTSHEKENVLYYNAYLLS